VLAALCIYTFDCERVTYLIQRNIFVSNQAMAQSSRIDQSHWLTFGEIVVSAVNTLILIQGRVSIWGEARAIPFLRWWTSELRRSVADTIKRGLIEMEREDSGKIILIGTATTAILLSLSLPLSFT